ncbi:spermatid nuclear transition protein 3-like [Ovis canadensis]|uniref:spermatid nuclear transition protein 3-like n=1 Tax=Ovis canadensis TaxID=37174 RepID=UPI0038B5A18A
MAKGTRKPRQPRRVAVRFASRMKGRKKTLWQRRYRGSVKARNMTMRVRRPLKGTLRKKIRSYATPSKKVKKTREPNCFLRSCARTKYDHEGQKTSKRNLEKENPIVRHSVEEGEENKRTKLFSPFLCT